jgi:hypothetical protein
MVCFTFSSSEGASAETKPHQDVLQQQKFKGNEDHIFILDGPEHNLLLIFLFNLRPKDDVFS